MGRMILKRIFLMAGALVILAGTSCAVNPVTGRQEISLISEEKEIEIGRNSDPEILRKYGAYPDPALQNYISSIGEALARNSHRPSIAYHFKVVDSPAVNAFALPGGYVYVTRGMLAYLGSEAELAGVMGHEIGHVTERHAVQQLTAAFGLQLTSMILSAAVKGGGEFSRLTDVLSSGIINGYGRGKELSADRLGQDYMFKTGYDPEASVSFLTALQRTEGDPLDPVSHWLAGTHPYASERIRKAQVHARELDPQMLVKTRNRERYLSQINGMVFGAGERDGLLAGRRYQNRFFRVSCEVPEGWTVRTGRDTWAAETPDKKYRMQFRLEELKEAVDLNSFAFRMEQGMELNHGELLSRGRRNGMETLMVRYRAASGSVILGEYLLRDRVGIALYGMVPEVSTGQLTEEWRRVEESIQTLSESEAGAIPLARIRIHQVRPGDTFSGLAMEFLKDPKKAKEIAEINGMSPDASPALGSAIKVITSY